MTASMQEHVWRIGELAAELGINPKTIRYYEDIGVLPRPRRTPSGYRTYSEVDRDRLGFILKARAIGFTLEEIGDILRLRGRGERPCGHVLALLDRKIASIDEQLRALRDVRRQLLELRHSALENLPSEGAICGIIEHQDWPESGPPRRTGTSRPKWPASVRHAGGGAAEALPIVQVSQ
jgi:MerR family transcriptional regulator, Zn(II)-responsive regulator of zntA